VKFLVRYLGLVVADKDLEPGEYTIGRAPESDIRLTQDFISRRHGKLYEREGKWFYQDLREGHPHHSPEPRELTAEAMIELENDIDLMMAGYLAAQETQVYDIRDLKSMAERAARNRRRIFAVSLTVLVLSLLAGGGYLVYELRKPMDAQALLDFVRPKVVEFELISRKADIEEIKARAKLTDSDFKPSVGFCSGFIVAPDVVLTAHHCIRGRLGVAEVNTQFRLKTHDDRRHRAARVLGFNLKRDYLFLEVPGLARYGHLKLAEAHEVGQKVYTIGNVSGEGIAIRDGITASTTKDPNNPKIEYLRFSAAASPGNSGGPLVDGYGNVVGLVFAGTFSENYNLATAAEHLAAGQRRFVAQRKLRKIEIDTQEVLNFNGQQMANALGLPSLSAWYQNPEYPLPLASLAFEVEVPATLESLARDVASALNKELRRVYGEIINRMVEAGHGEGRWQHLVQAETPPLVPLQLDDAISRPHALSSGQLYGDYIRLFSPPDRRSFDAFLKSYRKEKAYTLRPPSTSASLVELDPTAPAVPTAAGATTDGAAPGSLQRCFAQQSGDKVHLYMLVHGTAATACLAYDDNPSAWAAAREPKARQLAADLLGKKGALFNTRFFPFVRPKGHRDFTLDRLPEKATTASVKDGIGRDWKRFSWPLFGIGELDSYCLPLPQGRLCLSTIIVSQEQATIETLRANLLHFKLAERILEPLFWHSDALLDYYAQGLGHQLIALRDARLERRDDGTLAIELQTLGVRLLLPEKERPLMLRFLTGYLQPPGGAQPKWVALGFEGYRPDDKEPQICAAALEPKEQPIWYVRHLAQEQTKHFNEVFESSKKLPLSISPVKLEGDSDYELVSYCKPYKSDEKQKRLQPSGESRPYAIAFERL
jgi:S1-C subfamily serine protease